MFRLILPIILLSILSLNVTAKSDSTKQFGKLMLEITAGKGQFFLGKPIPYTNELYNQYELGMPYVGSVNFSYNFKIRAGKDFTQKLFGVGGGLAFTTYTFKHIFSDYQEPGKTYSYYYEFSKHESSYNINMLHYKIFFSKGTYYTSGFFLRNCFGVCLNTYVNKKTDTYTLHTTGSELTYDPASPYASPFGYYYKQIDNYEKVTEKNYSRTSYSAFYSLDLGFKFKKIVYYAAPELFILNNQWNSIIKLQAGIIFLM